MHPNKIDEFIRLNELSHEEVARLSGITSMTLWNARQGKNVTLETMKKIAKALGTSVWKLWPEEEIAA